MSEVQNAGRKGYCFMIFLVSFILFILLLVWIYNLNMTNVPVSQ